MGIDGTWRRDCTMEDVSEGGAKLVVHRPVEGLPPERVCCLRPALPTAAANAVNGDRSAVFFLKPNNTKPNTAT